MIFFNILLYRDSTSNRSVLNEGVHARMRLRGSENPIAVPSHNQLSQALSHRGSISGMLQAQVFIQFNF